MEYTIGSQVFDGWTIVREIGEGSYGKVFEVCKEKGGIAVTSALKVIRIPRSPSDVREIRAQGMDEQSVTMYFHGFVEKLLREITIMSQLKSHPNIVSYEDHDLQTHAGDFGWDILIRMELLTPLHEYMTDHPMNAAEVRKLGIDLCSALIFCEKKSILHRDIKPSNIFVSPTGQFKLGDFGVAKVAERSVGTARQGTESYMAPEVYLSRPYGPSVDIYSLGIVLFQLMNGGRLPFYPPAGQLIGASDRDRALARRMSGEPLPQPANAGQEFTAIIQKACAFDPAKRYRTAADMLDHLENGYREAAAPPAPAKIDSRPADEVIRSFDEGSEGLTDGPFSRPAPKSEGSTAPFDDIPEELTDGPFNQLPPLPPTDTNPPAAEVPPAPSGSPASDSPPSGQPRIWMTAGGQTGPTPSSWQKAEPPVTLPKGLPRWKGMLIAVAVMLAVLLLIFIWTGAARDNSSPAQTASKPSQSTPAPQAGAVRQNGQEIYLGRSVALYESPDPTSKVLVTVPRNGTVKLANKTISDEDWQKVSYGGQSGYVQTLLLTEKTAAVSERWTPTALYNEQLEEVGELPESVALKVLGVTFRRNYYYFRIAYQGQNYFVEDREITLSENFYDDEMRSGTLRVPLRVIYERLAVIMLNDEENWLSNPVGVEKNVNIADSIVPGWYLVTTTDGSAHYATADYFADYYDSIQECDPDAPRVWEDGTPASDEDRAMMAKWEAAQKKLASSVRLGENAPDYFSLTDEEITDALFASSPYCAKVDDYTVEYDDELGAHDLAVISFSKDNGCLTVKSSLKHWRNSDANYDNAANWANTYSILPQNVFLGDSVESICAMLGISEEMIEWSSAHTDELSGSTNWYNLNELIYDNYYGYSIRFNDDSIYSLSSSAVPVSMTIFFDEDSHESWEFDIRFSDPGFYFPSGLDRIGLGRDK